MRMAEGKGYAKDADRLVVISDSQDIDAQYGSKRKPDTAPYKTSYIIDISTHTHGIKPETGQQKSMDGAIVFSIILRLWRTKIY